MVTAAIYGGQWQGKQEGQNPVSQTDSASDKAKGMVDVCRWVWLDGQTNPMIGPCSIPSDRPMCYSLLARFACLW